ncbi:MAG: 30S ribosome-binding factor RbfA [Myxococcota bacterium]|mgnify:FL=1|nr:30S ribosome-binding factor RbfA [Myxococcota bacterium]
MSQRTDRISYQLREEIARVLREEVADTRVNMVTIMRVDTAPDLSNAIVLWSLFSKDGEPDSDQLDTIEDGLESAAGFIRKRVAKSLKTLRRSPALRFKYDPSQRLAGETNELLQEVKSDGEETEQ